MTQHSQSSTRQHSVRDELRALTGVGPSIAADLRALGVRSIRDLAHRDPELLYDRLCRMTGERQDPCVVYVFRCAVYAARTSSPDPELLKWWSWKGRTLTQRRKPSTESRRGAE